VYQTTLGELGNKLPIGLLQDDGSLLKDFDLRPYKGHTDRAISKWQSQNSDNGPGHLVVGTTTKLISLCVSHIHGHATPLTTQNDSSPDTLAKIYSWPFMDVMYLNLYIRRQVLGPDFLVPVGCPQCGFKGNMCFDLDSIPVWVAESGEDLFQWYDLRDHIKVKETIRSVRVGYSLWSTIAKPGVIEQAAQGTHGLTALQECLTAVNREETQRVILPDEIDEFSKYDLVKIEQLTAKTMAGPKMQTVVYCPGDHKGDTCNFPFVNPMDWTYDHFFGMSFPQGDMMS